MILVLFAVAAAAAVYQVIALLACLRQALRTDPPPASLPPVSILKPVHGLDAQFAHAVETHLRQDYPRFELIAASLDAADPALAEAAHLGARTVVAHTRTANGKVGVLADSARAARFPTHVVNDADIAVPQGYLRAIAAGLEQPGIGLVTCLYRANGITAAGLWEALGIATDFTPSVLVAPLFGVNEFALGSTMAVRAEDLAAIGGFEAIGDYVADDYQLGKRICARGKRVWLTRLVVETTTGGSWSDAWHHQVRWARTIRLSRGAYAGLPFTNATLWASLLAAAGEWRWGAALLALRIAVGLAGGLGVLSCRVTRRYWWLMPARDLWGFAVWLAGMFGSRVVWRGTILSLDRDGRILNGRRNADLRVQM